MKVFIKPNASCGKENLIVDSAHTGNKIFQPPLQLGGAVMTECDE